MLSSNQNSHGNCDIHTDVDANNNSNDRDLAKRNANTGTVANTFSNPTTADRDNPTSCHAGDNCPTDGHPGAAYRTTANGNHGSTHGNRTCANCDNGSGD